MLSRLPSSRTPARPPTGAAGLLDTLAGGNAYNAKCVSGFSQGARRRARARGVVVGGMDWPAAPAPRAPAPLPRSCWAAARRGPVPTCHPGFPSTRPPRPSRRPRERVPREPPEQHGAGRHGGVARRPRGAQPQWAARAAVACDAIRTRCLRGARAFHTAPAQMLTRNPHALNQPQAASWASRTRRCSPPPPRAARSAAACASAGARAGRTSRPARGTSRCSTARASARCARVRARARACRVCDACLLAGACSHVASRLLRHAGRPRLPPGPTLSARERAAPPRAGLQPSLSRVPGATSGIMS